MAGDDAVILDMVAERVTEFPSFRIRGEFRHTIVQTPRMPRPAKFDAHRHQVRRGLYSTELIQINITEFNVIIKINVASINLTDFHYMSLVVLFYLFILYIYLVSYINSPILSDFVELRGIQRICMIYILTLALHSVPFICVMLNVGPSYLSSMANITWTNSILETYTSLSYTSLS